MKQKAFRKLLFLSYLSLISAVSFSQGLYEVSLDSKIQHASLIVEGKVISQQSFWNPQHTMIYTSNTIEVYKDFKGNSMGQLEVLTTGGQVGNDIIQASDLLTLSSGQLGVFFLYPNSMRLQSPVDKSVLFDVYSSQQGFIEYDLSNQQASAPFAKYRSIATELYSVLQNKIGQAYADKKPSFNVTSFTPAAPNQIAAITSFSPATVTAGTILDPTNNVLTIDGSGFGTGSGTAAILFDDADDGSGGTALTVLWNSVLVISWSDTRIEVRVPGDAGTGTFQVRDAAGVTSTSPSALNVLYSVAQGTAFGMAKEFRLANRNGSGGYTIVYNTNIASTTSQATFQRALTTWKEVCGANIAEGSTTTTQLVSGDAENIIMLDNAGTGNAPLADGVLGVCYSYYITCPGATAADQVLKSGFDIVLRNPGFSSGSADFEIGPCPPVSSNFNNIDLETVILHELGHALNLGHIIDGHQFTGFAGQMNMGKIMHFAAVNGSKRTSPDYAAKSGVDYTVTPRGITFGACATEMTRLSTTLEARDNCPGTFPTTTTPTNTAITFDLNHATSNKYVDPDYTQIRCDAGGTNVTNNAYYAFKTNNAGGIVSINVSGYATTPAAQTSCTSAYGASVLATGVRLALYQVSSCPTAQSFPAPIACRTITTNGALADITGLAASTTYLLYLGGVENTRASFTLTFTGNALPLNLSEFSGEVMADHNLLHWVIDYARDVKSIYIERSSDGINFGTIGEVTSSLATKKGSFKDNRSTIGNNFYRLLIFDVDGSKNYSSIVTLKRKDNFLVSVTPNPVKDIINIDVSTATSGTYTFVLHNAAGQAVKRMQSFIQMREQVKINVSQLSKGTYQLSVFDQKGVLVKGTQLLIQ